MVTMTRREAIVPVAGDRGPVDPVPLLGPARLSRRLRQPRLVRRASVGDERPPVSHP